MEADNVWFAFGLTLFAGLATGVGSTIAIHNFPEGLATFTGAMKRPGRLN